MADSVDPDPPPPPPPEEVVVTPPEEQPKTPIPADAPPPRQGCWEKRSCIEKVLIVFLIIIIFVCLAFVGLFIVYYLFSAPPQGTCLTEECVAAASRLKAYMDEDVEPCNNFYEYACGGWMKKQVLAPDEDRRDVASMISDSNDVKIKSLLESPPPPTPQAYQVKPRAFYKACMDEALLEEKGSAPFFELLEEVGKFPTLASDWNETKFSLEETLVNLAKFVEFPLFSVSVERDSMSDNINRIYIGDARLPGVNRNMKREDPSVKRFETSLVDRLVELGADAEEAKEDMAAVVDFEIGLAQIQKPGVKNEDKDPSSNYNPMTVAMLQSKYTWLNWMEFFQGYSSDLENGGRVFVGVEETVINTVPSYLEQLGDVLMNTDERVLANYLMASMLKKTGFLGQPFVDMSNKYMQDVAGYKAKPRWEVCTSFVTDTFPEAVGRMYIDKYFSRDAKEYMKTMMEDLRGAFNELLMENTWMADKTKQQADAKLKLMNAKIGYPEYLFDDERLNDMYSSVSADETKFMETVRDNWLHVTRENLKTLGETVDTSKWNGIYPAHVNSVYQVLDNEIIFPAAFLQAPVYDPGYSSSMNYGGIGMVIGHEITHPFDNKGKHVNAKGELKTWWTKKDTDNFKYRAECFEDQYGCYKWDGHSIDGVRTLRQNIADNGGLKQSYRAYRNLVRRRGIEEQRLPGLDLDHNQIFFLSFAQVWCAKFQDEAKEKLVKTDNHAPPAFRVKGTLQNSQEFAQAFGCQVGSRMNPMRKCVIW